MTLDLAHLRRVAEAGAKGNWQQDPEDSWSICTNDNVCVAYAQGCVNADHIAACNPATILALLDRLEAAERVVEAARRLTSQTAEYPYALDFAKEIATLEAAVAAMPKEGE